MKGFNVTESRFPQDKDGSVACFLSFQFELEGTDRVEFYRSSKKKEGEGYNRYKAGEVQGNGAHVEIVGLSVFRTKHGYLPSQDVVLPPAARAAVIAEAEELCGDTVEA